MVLAHGSFDVYVDNSGKYRWRLTSADGLPIAFTDQAYETRAAAITASESAQRAAAGATIADASV